MSSRIKNYRVSLSNATLEWFGNLQVSRYSLYGEYIISQVGDNNDPEISVCLKTLWYNGVNEPRIVSFGVVTKPPSISKTPVSVFNFLAILAFFGDKNLKPGSTVVIPTEFELDSDGYQSDLTKPNPYPPYYNEFNSIFSRDLVSVKFPSGTHPISWSVEIPNSLNAQERVVELESNIAVALFATVKSGYVIPIGVPGRRVDIDNYLRYLSDEINPFFTQIDLRNPEDPNEINSVLRNFLIAASLSSALTNEIATKRIQPANSEGILSLPEKLDSKLNGTYQVTIYEE